jgi:hypothetical protein
MAGRIRHIGGKPDQISRRSPLIAVPQRRRGAPKSRVSCVKDAENPVAGLKVVDNSATTVMAWRRLQGGCGQIVSWTPGASVVTPANGGVDLQLLEFGSMRSIAASARTRNRPRLGAVIGLHRISQPVAGRIGWVGGLPIMAHD